MKKIPNKWLLIFVVLLFLSAATGYALKNYVFKEKIVPQPTKTFVDDDEVSTWSTSTWEISTLTWSTEETESGSISTTDKQEFDWDKTLGTPSVFSKHEYVLISWIPSSYELQTVYIGLYDTTDKVITYLPYDYHIPNYKGETNKSLGNLDSKQLKEYLLSQGIRLTGTFTIDKDVISDLFTKVMTSGDYTINYKDEKGESRTITVKSKDHLYNLLGKDNISNFTVLEQLHNELSKLLQQYNQDYMSKMSMNPDVMTTDSLYSDPRVLSITGKYLTQKQVNSKFFSVDENSEYLKSLINDDFTQYQEMIKAKEQEKQKIIEQSKQELEQLQSQLTQSWTVGSGSISTGSTLTWSTSTGTVTTTVTTTTNTINSTSTGITSTWSTSTGTVNETKKETLKEKMERLRKEKASSVTQ